MSNISIENNLMFICFDIWDLILQYTSEFIDIAHIILLTPDNYKNFYWYLEIKKKNKWKFTYDYCNDWRVGNSLSGKYSTQHIIYPFDIIEKTMYINIKEVKPECITISQKEFDIINSNYCQLLGYDIASVSGIFLRYPHTENNPSSKYYLEIFFVDNADKGKYIKNSRKTNVKYPKYPISDYDSYSSYDDSDIEYFYDSDLDDGISYTSDDSDRDHDDSNNADICCVYPKNSKNDTEDCIFDLVEDYETNVKYNYNFYDKPICDYEEEEDTYLSDDRNLDDYYYDHNNNYVYHDNSTTYTSIVIYLEKV